MTKTPAEIEAQVVTLIGEIARDWDYTDAIGPNTRLFGDLGFESLDAVVLGTAIQERFQRNMPFAELLADVGQRSTPELTLGELVAFIQTHVSERVVEA